MKRGENVYGSSHWIMTAVAFSVCLLSLNTISAQTWPESSRQAKAGSRWWVMGSAWDKSSVEHRIAEYAKAGIGTLEITPIYSLKKPSNTIGFLTGSWMSALKYVEDAAEANGVDIDMNCGTGWPFGGPSVTIDEAAGKLEYVTGEIMGDGTTTQTFDITLNSSALPKLNRVMAYPGKGNSGSVQDVTLMLDGKILRWVAPEGKWRIIAIYNSHTMQSVKRAAPGGEGYVLDHFDSAAVANYLKRFDDAFSTSGVPYPKYFFNDSYEVYNADWTPKMFDEFYKYRGYRLEENMDKLLGFATDVNKQVLADYRMTLQDMLLNNFTRQWTTWAHSHGVKTRNQAHGSPGNLLDFYAAVDIPEIEGFGLTDFGIRGLRTDRGFTRDNYSDFATLKYASSAAHVTGKQLTSSETFTWLTEHFRTSLSQMKPDMDLMFCAGVNHIFFHGTTYTPDNTAWPGWKFYASIDMSPTNSIWRDAPAMMQYMERCQSFLQKGQPDNDLLVYVPFVNAMHGNIANRLLMFSIDNISAKMGNFTAAVSAIEEAGLDCDFISDAQLLATISEGGMLKTSGGQTYSALVVPVSTNMPAETKACIDNLAAAGANIVYKYDAATLSSIPNIKPEQMRTDYGLRMIRRKYDNGYIYFVSNLQAHDVCGYMPLGVGNPADVLCYDAMTGSIYRPVRNQSGVMVELRSGESIIIETHDTPVADVETVSAMAEYSRIELGGEWNLSFIESYPEVSETFTLSDGVKTWENLSDVTGQLMGTGVYEKTFTIASDVAALADGGWKIDLGDVRESARVYLNGEYVGCAWAAPFVVRCAATAIHAGANTIRIEVTNLPANRIRQMDIDGKEWRIFGDVNILDVKDGNLSVSGITSYADWQKMPSGLNSTVTIAPLKNTRRMLTARLSHFEKFMDSKFYYPVYELYTADVIKDITVSAVDGSTYADADIRYTDDGCAYLMLRKYSDQNLVVKCVNADGLEYTTLLEAHGPYQLKRSVDFTSNEAPAPGWQGTATVAPNGFTDKFPFRQGKKSGKILTEYYDSLTVKASGNSTSVGLWYYNGAGLQFSVDAELRITADPDDVFSLSYLVGETGNTKAYNAADSLVQTIPASVDGSALFKVNGRNKFHIYRSLNVFSPAGDPSAIRDVHTDGMSNDYAVGRDVYYNLNGQRVAFPQKGIYIINGKKVLKNNSNK